MMDRGRIQRTARTHRRRGNVLVMVVSMLVMLFVFGSTFLLTARFNRLAAEDQAAANGGGASLGANNRYSVRLAELIASDISRQLREDLVGGDGLPFNGEGELKSPTGNLPADVVEDYGDGPGIDGLLSSLEPYYWNRDGMSGTDPVAELFWHELSKPHDFLDRFYSDSPHAQQIPTTVSITDIRDLPVNGNMHPLINLPYRSMQYEWQQVVGRTVPTVPDAEGDGMPSSLIWSSIDRETDPLLIDEDSTATRVFGQRFAAAVRVIPNNAMVTLYREEDSGQYFETPKSLIDVVRNPGDPDLDAFVNPTTSNPTPTFGPIQPEIEEPALRNRFFLPRNVDNPLVDTTLLENRWPNTLLPNYLRLPVNNGPFRHWPIEYFVADISGFTGNAASATADNELWWATRVTPFDPVGNLHTEYDRRHLITTMGADDICRRRADGPGSVAEDAAISFYGSATTVGFVLDRYPFDPAAPGVPTGSPGQGLVQFSLREPWLDNNQTLVSKGDQLLYLYAYYRAMLAHVDNAAMSAAEKNKRAAVLAINTYDFFDSDYIPTTSKEIVGTQLLGSYESLTANTKDLIGIEGQPFITEVYVNNTGPDPSDTYEEYGVELFNPWPYDVELTAGDWALSAGAAIPTVDLTDLPITIPAATTPGLVNADDSNVIVFGNLASVVPGGLSMGRFHLEMSLSLNKGASNAAVVSLWRRHPTTGSWVRVDEVRTTAGIDSDSPWPQDNPGAMPIRESFERRLLQFSGGIIRSDWKFCLGIEKKTSIPSLGTANSAVVMGAAGVPLLSNNSGNPRFAFPTTGSLLLVNSLANENVGVLGAGDVFSTLLVEDANSSNSPPLKANIASVDNGHMPIFDQSDDMGTQSHENFRANVSAPDQGNHDGDDLPWGQLVFDYFTTLPVAGPVDTQLPEDTALPLVEKIVDDAGIAFYGPRVRGRININAAPWTVMDGLPALNDGNELPVSELDPTILGYPDSLDPALGGAGWFHNPSGAVDGWSITPEFALLIQSYREERDVLGQGLSLGTTSALWPNNPNTRSSTNGVRQQRGLLSVGELANVIISAGHSGGDWGTPGALGIDFASAVAPLVRIKDWATVKSNVFTVYTTVVDTDDPEGTARMQLTIDRTRCLYSNEQPAVISRSVLRQ